MDVAEGPEPDARVAVHALREALERQVRVRRVVQVPAPRRARRILSNMEMKLVMTRKTKNQKKKKKEEKEKRRNGQYQRAWRERE